MLAFLKGAGEYIAGTIAGKIIVIAVAGGVAATGTGVAIHNQIEKQNSLQIKTLAVSTASVREDNIMSLSESAPSSNDTSSVDLAAISKATSEGVSKIQGEASKAVSQIQAVTSSSVVITDYGYAIINPTTGKMVWPGDADYDKYKSELGGDAGTVDPNKSTAVQDALKKLKAAWASSIAAARAAQSSSTK